MRERSINFKNNLFSPVRPIIYTYPDEFQIELRSAIWPTVHTALIENFVKQGLT